MIPVLRNKMHLPTRFPARFPARPATTSLAARVLPLVLPLVLAVVLVLPATTRASVVRVEHVEAELVADADAVVPGKPVIVALRLRHDPHWHTYWQYPGDSGLPTTISWQLPSGFKAGPIAWPLPQKIPTGPLVNYGYEGMVLLPTSIDVPATLAPGGTARFAAKARWLMCSDVCIPGQADLDLELPVAAAPNFKPARWTAAIAVARGQVPRPLSLDGAQATLDGRRVRLAFSSHGAAPSDLSFLPLDPGRIDDEAAQRFQFANGTATLELTAADPVDADFQRLHGVLVAGGPEPWAGEVDIPLARGKIAAAPPTASGPASDAAGSGGGAPAGWVALAGALLGGLILNLMPCVFPILSLKVVGIVQHGSRGSPPYRHGLAFAAGTVVSFVALAGLLLALRAAGTQVGWGFQLQTPWVIAALTTLFFVIGLNLLGAFEFTFGSTLANAGPLQRLSAQDGERAIGSFATGVLAVIVAAPCTAPFMGAALGYAVTQPAPLALAIFAALGVGMAIPYLLLTVFPGWQKVLPRPGAWMIRLRQAFAFPMFATCVWLLWVLGQQLDINAIALVLGALVAVALAAWAVGLAQRGTRRWGWVSLAVSLAAAILAVYGLVAATATDPSRNGAAEAKSAAGSPPARGAKAAPDGTPWSAAAVETSLAAGHPVFVDFTAAWCVTCQANKRLVLHSRRVRDEFASRQVTLLVADWTRGDETITRELARYQRTGVPMYLMYDRHGTARLLPELLTEQGVIDAIDAS
jgi:thiol:disulfide interchange protein/DsbC/DsbD-like thiol-disulfide interchange protein